MYDNFNGFKVHHFIQFWIKIAAILTHWLKIALSNVQCNKKGNVLFLDGNKYFEILDTTVLCLAQFFFKKIIPEYKIIH